MVTCCIAPNERHSFQFQLEVCCTVDVPSAAVNVPSAAVDVSPAVVDSRHLVEVHPRTSVITAATSQDIQISKTSLKMSSFCLSSETKTRGAFQRSYCFFLLALLARSAHCTDFLCGNFCPKCNLQPIDLFLGPFFEFNIFHLFTPFCPIAEPP